jgi:predicted DNA-binding transcriptional regulator AlpA
VPRTPSNLPTAAITPDDGLSTLRQVAARTRLHRQSIRRMVRQGRFPKPVGKIADKLMWSTFEVEGWIRDQLQASVPEREGGGR